MSNKHSAPTHKKHSHTPLSSLIQSLFFIIQICVWLRSQALEAVNTRLRELYPESEELFDVVLMTNNHANVGLRLINTINHYREFQKPVRDKNVKVAVSSMLIWSKHVSCIQLSNTVHLAHFKFEH